MKFFDSQLFSNFFDTQEIIDKESDIVLYSITTKDNLLLSLYVSPHGHVAILSLKTHNTSTPIVELNISNLATITCDNDHLYFYKEQRTNQALEKAFLVVKVKPNVVINFDL